jgi:hypothetical protein
MTDTTIETIETLQQKLKIYQQLFETLAPSAPLNILTPSQSTNTSTPTLDSATPATPATPAAPATPIFKPNKRYIKVEEILRLTGLRKNEYNNLLVRRKLIFKYFYYLLK